MDFGRVLTMLARMLMRRGLGRLMRGMTRRPGPDDRGQTQQGKELARRARQAARLTRMR